MRQLRLRPRVRDWELILARVRTFGFAINDDGHDMIAVTRDGRTCTIDLVGTVRFGASDPRDLWLLKHAVENDGAWAARESYFLRRIRDGDIVPVELRLGYHSDAAQTLFLDHDMLDGRNERMTLDNIERLMDLLPPLGPSNSIGYHRARNRIVDAFEQLRPKTWAEIGIDDHGIIAEYKKYQVTADHVAHARAGGRETMEQIIAGYGIPPNGDWVDIRDQSN